MRRNGAKQKIKKEKRWGFFLKRGVVIRIRFAFVPSLPPTLFPVNESISMMMMMMNVEYSARVIRVKLSRNLKRKCHQNEHGQCLVIDLKMCTAVGSLRLCFFELKKK